jgi:hypothetical protein
MVARIKPEGPFSATGLKFSGQPLSAPSNLYPKNASGLQISEGKQPRIVDPFSRAEKSSSAAALLAASNTIVQPSFAGCCMDFKRSCHCHAGRYISRRGSTWSDPGTAPDLTSWIMASFKLNEPQFDCHPVPHTAQESSSAPRPSNSSQRLTGALSHGAFSRFESPYTVLRRYFRLRQCRTNSRATLSVSYSLDM